MGLMSTTTRPAARILAALGTGIRPAWEIERDTGLSRSTVRRHVAAMVASGILLACPYGVFAASAVAS